MRRFLFLLALLTPSWAMAADNAVIVTPGTGVTMKSKDVGAGVQAMQPVLSDTTGTPLTINSGALAVSPVGVGQGSTTNGQTGSLDMGAVTTTAPTYTNAQTSPLSLDTSGNLRTAPQATAGGGATLNAPIVPTASDNHAVIKNGAGTVYSVHTSNNSATKNYLRLYDAGTGFNGCNSATNAIFAMEIAPNDSGFSVAIGGAVGGAFTNGLSICVTSGFGLTDTTNATATAIYVNVAYK